MDPIPSSPIPSLKIRNAMMHIVIAANRTKSSGERYMKMDIRDKTPATANRMRLAVHILSLYFSFLTHRKYPMSIHTPRPPNNTVSRIFDDVSMNRFFLSNSQVLHSPEAHESFPAFPNGGSSQSDCIWLMACCNACTDQSSCRDSSCLDECYLPEH